jgi:hypothetical protein
MKPENFTKNDELFQFSFSIHHLTTILHKSLLSGWFESQRGICKNAIWRSAARMYQLEGFP